MGGRMITGGGKESAASLYGRSSIALVTQFPPLLVSSVKMLQSNAKHYPRPRKALEPCSFTPECVSPK